ncbi:kinase-like protein [Leucogyrophana mollusca]|uniref:Kinase-like protein n=1 Tax=Leucogyrophana mollusca TaxID=85980 RepID=A0ACB8BNX9_9AGAM|nr:kinase-like protein [Leucogyrophana mollusca]
MKIYQHLAIHAFFHLVRGRNQSLLVAFQNHIKEWKQWDIIRCLTNHQIIRDSLLALLLTSEELSPMCHSPGVDVSELPKLDAKVMVLHLAAILDDSDLSSRKHKDIFALRGKDAQSMVDLLHDLLEGPVIDSDQRTLLTDALVRLTRRSCCHPKCFVLNDIEIDVTHPVIAGGYSEVWKGYILGRPVAVKKVRNSRSDLEEILKACAREAIIWSRLSHPNLLPFYGIFYLDDECSRISLVSPWMDNGDVSQYLKHFPDTNRELLALDVSLGVEYLHTSMPAVIHGDLKPRNIFITSSGTACLADFGLAYAKDPQRLTATSTEGPVHSGTLAYEAPEMFDGHPVSFAADVYAFACVVYEMYSGSPPFHELRPAGVIRAIIGGQRPLRPVGISSSVWGVVENCWQQGPAERPCASDIVHDLRSIAGPEQRPHQWDESFRAHIRSSHSSYWLTPSGRCSDTWTSLHMT